MIFTSFYLVVYPLTVKLIFIVILELMLNIYQKNRIGISCTPDSLNNFDIFQKMNFKHSTPQQKVDQYIKLLSIIKGNGLFFYI